MTFSGGFGRVFRPVFDPGLAARNGLLNALIAYWKLDEASGSRYDSHGANTLTEVVAVNNRAGKIGSAVNLNGSSFALTIADNAALSTGDVDFTISAWVLFDAFATGVSREAYTVFSKFNVSGNQREFLCFYDRAETIPYNRFKWLVSSNGSAVSKIDSTETATTATWYHVICWHDAANDQIGISVNGVETTTSYSGGVYNSTASFDIGRLLVPTSYYLLDGAVDEVAMWKSAAGGGGVLTAAQRTALYNGGAGLAYAQFTT